jgi:hypothetical protein
MFSVLRLFVAGNTVSWVKIVLELLSCIQSDWGTFPAWPRSSRQAPRDEWLLLESSYQSVAVIITFRKPNKHSPWLQQTLKISPSWPNVPSMWPEQAVLKSEFFFRKLPKSRGWSTETGFCDVYKEWKFNGFLKRLGNTTCGETDVLNVYKGLVIACLAVGCLMLGRKNILK